MLAAYLLGLAPNAAASNVGTPTSRWRQTDQARYAFAFRRSSRASNRLRRIDVTKLTARTLILCALLGVLSAGMQSRLSADGPCPTNGGACTRSCVLGGSGCTAVECINGGELGQVCKYTGCSCDDWCVGDNCELLPN